jgi:hypothetical protein
VLQVGATGINEPTNRTGNDHRDFLLHVLPKLLEAVPLEVTARMWYMNDAVPAQFCRLLRDVLSSTWILPVGLHKIPCVCRSCSQQRGTSSSHCGCLSRLSAIIPVDIFISMLWSVTRRVEGCIQPHRGHFQPLKYTYSFRKKPQIKCFRTYDILDIFLVLVCGNRAPNFPHFSVTPCKCRVVYSI